jgi:hypothetical protein
LKKLLTLLFSIFFLFSPSVFADGISDFEIEGISIGDSLLDYMTEDEILKEIERTKDFYYHLNEPNKYAEVYLVKKSENYDYLGFFIKNNSVNTYVTNKNEKYTILSIRGLKRYIEDFDSCILNRNQIVDILSKMFPDREKVKEIRRYPGDPSGNSIGDTIYFDLDIGNKVRVYCSNFEETFRIKMKWSEGLTVLIISSEIHEWLNDYN